MIGFLLVLTIFAAPALAVYSVFNRMQNLKTDQTGYVYNGKMWVSWLWVISAVGTLFCVFGSPLITGVTTNIPEWDKLPLLFYGIILYISYIVIAFRPATAEELAEAEKEGNAAINATGAATASVLKGILMTVLAALASIPALIWNALNPVQAIKVIGGVTYKIIGTGFSSILGGVVALGILAAMVAFVVLFGSVLVSLLGTFALAIIAIVKFVMNYRLSAQKEAAAE